MFFKSAHMSSSIYVSLGQLLSKITEPFPLKKLPNMKNPNSAVEHSIVLYGTGPILLK